MSPEVRDVFMDGIKSKIRRLPRQRMVEIFENHGFQVYEGEDHYELSQHMLVNIMDGTISITELEAV